MHDKNGDAIARLRAIERQNARAGVSAIRLQSIVSRDPEKRIRVKVKFLDTGKIHRIKRVKVEKFRIPGLRTSTIPFKNPELSGEKEEAEGIGEQPAT